MKQRPFVCGGVQHEKILGNLQPLRMDGLTNYLVLDDAHSQMLHLWNIYIPTFGLNLS